MNDAASTTGVMIWWTLISVVGVANIAAWVVTAIGVYRRQLSGDRSRSHAHRRRHLRLGLQLLLSALFVGVCAFRSFLPRAEGQRICLYDGWISSAVIGRAVATVAELSLVAQWTLVLRGLSRHAGGRRAGAVSWLLLPLIAGAEVCSWYTALTTNFMGSVIEESTWAVTSTLMIAGLLPLWRRTADATRRFVRTAIVLNAAYVVFMVSVDVPMYRARWRADQRQGKHYLTVGEGWRDASRRWVVTRRWIDWRQEMPWMSLYFSAGVWISLALVRAPRPEREGPP